MSRTGGFAALGAPLDSAGLSKASRRADRLPSAQCWSSPSRSADETATALGLDYQPELLLADIDYGDWSGKSFLDVQRADPAAFEQWLSNPNAGAPGGETMAQLVARVGSWLDRHSIGNRTVVGVTHATTIRACIVHALEIPAHATLRIDIAPLDMIILSYNRIWRLQALRPL